MTGKDLIKYILENNLENEELLSTGLEPLLISADKAAIKWGCGPATVRAMVEMQRIRGTKIGNEYFIFALEPNPFEKRKD